MEAPADHMASKYIYNLEPSDVLLGRGRHVKHKGNSKFRAMVQSRVVEYVTNRNKSMKDAIARDIVKSVGSNGGRFVKPAASIKVVDSEGETIPVWEIADESTVLLKVKQTIRDYSVVARRAAAAESDSTLSTTGKHSTRPTENGSTEPNEIIVGTTASALHTTFRHSSNDQPARNFPERDSRSPLPAEPANTIASSSTMQQWNDEPSLREAQSLKLLLQQHGLAPRTLQQQTPLSYPESLIVGAPATSPSVPLGVTPARGVPDLNEALILNQLAQQIVVQNLQQNQHSLSSAHPIEIMYSHPSTGLQETGNCQQNSNSTDSNR